jgi:hypothetical protein
MSVDQLNEKMSKRFPFAQLIEDFKNGRLAQKRPMLLLKI